MNKIDPALAIEMPLLTSPGIAHAFFTRRAGVSTGAQSLNLSALVTLNQKHTPEVIAVEAPWDPGAAPEADALVTDKKGIALGIFTADCAPVLFADAEAGVVGAAHAGWRGAFDGVVGNTVAAMEDLGARADRIVCVVGPCIAQASYEVGAEFVERFLERDPAYERFFGPSPKTGHAHFNLAAFVAGLAADAGVGKVEIEGSDTCAREEQFFSYRRSVQRGEADYGRQLSAIGLLS